MQGIHKENLSPNRKMGEGIHRGGKASSSKCRGRLNSICQETNPGHHQSHSVSNLLAKLSKNTYLAHGIFSRGMQDLVPWRGMETGSLHWERRLSHWTTREVPPLAKLNDITRCRRAGGSTEHPVGGYAVGVSPAAAAKSLQSCPTLCDLMESSPWGSSVPGILQARTLEWVAISFSKRYTTNCFRKLWSFPWNLFNKNHYVL